MLQHDHAVASIKKSNLLVLKQQTRQIKSMSFDASTMADQAQQGREDVQAGSQISNSAWLKKKNGQVAFSNHT
jgi:hypothetical protein